MPDNNQTNTSLTNDVQAPQVPTTDPAGLTSLMKQAADGKESPVDLDEVIKKSKADAMAIMPEVASKVLDAHNILVALSSDPSVDEMCAAIGLSLYLDKLGKRATAIYSGATPNALEFLKPDETFDTSADTLQDFVIALNKEKADHLRYKLDGEYVKIFITPYRSRIAEEDLEFSYGDFNIDLVLALDVANGVDLDSALREHGRIMHDASVINVTTGNPGKFGEVEWSDKASSSVSEMASRLLYSLNSKIKLGPEEATAFLTGIVAATDRFSKGNTFADTMKIASQLIESGANPQLIAENITTDLDNQFFSYSNAPKVSREDDSSLDIKHPGEEGEESTEEVLIETEEAPEPVEEQAAEPAEEDKDPLLDELKATAESLATAVDVTAPEVKQEPVNLDSVSNEDTVVPTLPAPVETPEVPAEVVAEPAAISSDSGVKPEMVIAPPTDFAAETSGTGTNKYSEMLEAALAEAPVATPTAVVSPTVESNPAAGAVPAVPSVPEVNGVPDINFLPPTDQSFTPPTPPLDMNAPVSEAPSVPAPTPISQPAMQDQVYHPQASKPDAFKIPGM